MEPARIREGSSPFPTYAASRKKLAPTEEETSCIDSWWQLSAQGETGANVLLLSFILDYHFTIPIGEYSLDIYIRTLLGLRWILGGCTKLSFSGRSVRRIFSQFPAFGAVICRDNSCSIKEIQINRWYCDFLEGASFEKEHYKTCRTPTVFVPTTDGVMSIWVV